MVQFSQHSSVITVQSLQFSSLQLSVNTHCHADHVTGTGEMKKKLKEMQTGISSWFRIFHMYFVF